MRTIVTGVLALLTLLTGVVIVAPAASAATFSRPPTSGFFNPSEGTTVFPGGSVHAQGWQVRCSDNTGTYQAWAMNMRWQIAATVTGSVGAWTSSLTYTPTSTISTNNVSGTIPADAAGKYLIYAVRFQTLREGSTCATETSVDYYMAFAVGTPVAPTVTARSLSATAGTAITAFNMSVANSPTSYSATGLPAGLQIDATSGQISGTPTVAGTFSSTITATNAGGSGSGTLSSTIAYGTQASLSLTSTSGTFGTDLTLASSGGTGTGTKSYVVTSAGTAGCSLVGSSLRFTAIGSCAVTATKAGDAAYSPQSSSATTVTVSKGTPTITWATPSPITYPSVLSASQLNAVALLNGSPVPGSFVYSPSSGAVLSPGTQTLSAAFTPTDTTNVNSVPVTTVSLSVGQGTALVPQLSSATVVAGGFTASVLNFDSNFSWGVSASAGNASLDPTTHVISVSGLAAGGSSSVTVTASRTDYATGSTTLTSQALAVPVISSSATATAEVGVAFAGYAIAASNSPTSFSATGLPSPLVLDTQTGAISGVPASAGTFVITIGATNAAGTGSRVLTLTVNRGEQASLVLTTQSGAFGTPLPLAATGGSGTGALNFAISTVGTAGCVLSGNVLSSNQAGSCIIQVSRAGDTDYRDKLTLTQVDFARIPQSSLLITSSGSKGFDTPLALSAQGGDGGGLVSFSVTTIGSAGCVITNSTLVTSGDVGSSCGVTATRAESTNYLSKASPERFITVTTRGVQASLVMTSSGTIAYRTPLTLSASGGSGTGAVNFTVSTTGSANCSIVNGQLLSTGGLGTTCGIVAGRAESANYVAQVSAEQVITVGLRGAQLIDFAPMADLEYSPTPVDAIATSDSGLTVSLSSSTSSVCSISGHQVLPLSVGTCTIVASQGGNSLYFAASDVTQSFQVTRTTPTIDWGKIPDLTFGHSLTSDSFNPRSSVAGSFTFDWPRGENLPVGQYSVSMTFTPTDHLTYQAVTVIRHFSVLPEATALWWDPRTSLVGNAATFGIERATASREGHISYRIVGDTRTCVLESGESLVLRMSGNGPCEIRARIEASSTHAAAESYKTFRRLGSAQTLVISGNGSSESTGVPGAQSAGRNPTAVLLTRGILRLPPAPRSVTVRRVTSSTTRVTASQPRSIGFSEIDATVIEIRDSAGRRVSRTLVKNSGSATPISVTVPHMSRGYKGSVFNINRAGVSPRARLGANLLRRAPQASAAVISSGPRTSRLEGSLRFAATGTGMSVSQIQGLRKLAKSANGSSAPIFVSGQTRTSSASERLLARQRALGVCRALIRAGLRTWLSCLPSTTIARELPPGKVAVRISRGAVPALRLPS